MRTNNGCNVAYEDTMINGPTCHSYHFSVYKFIFLAQVLSIQGQKFLYRHPVISFRYHSYLPLWLLCVPVFKYIGHIVPIQVIILLAEGPLATSASTTTVK